MLTICLCDDDPVILKRYQMLIEKAIKNSIPAEIKTFLGGEQLLFYLEENPNDADIIFLDMMMGKINGIDTAKKLREEGCYAEIIYLTSNRDLVFDSFDTMPFHYLVKGDTRDERFIDILNRVVDVVDKKDSDFFTCSRGGVKKKVPIYRISHFDISGRIITMYYDGGKFDFYGKFGALQEQLEPRDFARCHKSVLVNLRFVDEIRKEDIFLTTGESVPLGMTYANEFKMAFSNYLSRTDPV